MAEPQRAAKTQSPLTPVGSDPAHWRGKYLEFVPAPKPGRKTMSWDVVGSDGSFIAEVHWFSRWRKYAFFPTQEAVYEETCLRDIATFLEERTREHKTGI